MVIIRHYRGEENKQPLSQIRSDIQQLRKAAGLTQEQLALAAGVNRSYMGDIEHGMKRPLLEKLAAIAHALHTALSGLFKGI